MEKDRSNFEVAPYSERKLSELLDYATENLYPTNLYTMNLKGVKPSLLTQKELQAYSGVDLDSSTGADIRFGFDESEDALVLKSIEHPLNKQSNAKFVIERTSSVEQAGLYTCYITIADEKYSPQGTDNGTSIDTDKVTDILAGYNIGDIPHPSDAAFALWKANILSCCVTGWDVHEEAEYIEDIQEHSIELINIQRDIFHNENGSGGQVKQASRIYDVRNDSTDHTLRVESRLTQTDFGYTRTVNLSNLFTDIPMATTETGNAKAPETKTEPAELNQNNYESFKRLLEEAHAHLRASK